MDTSLAADEGCASWLPALLHLASPVLPIGAFSYSQGMETACELGQVRDAASAAAWIESLWTWSVLPRELPTVQAAWDALQAGDLAALRAVHERFVASGDCAEARAETMQVGAALQRWLRALRSGGDLPSGVNPAVAAALDAGRWCAPIAFALCACAQGLPCRAASLGWGWSWLENQVQAAVKLVPLGQSDGQRVLVALRPRLFDPIPDEPWSFMPLAALCGMRHERQYTRLFRS
ncbi:MAG: urease accessory protein UreF [Burkholderiaceae bacterium]